MSNNKQCKVVMLPTNNNYKGILIKDDDSNLLGFNKEYGLSSILKSYTPQHIYFTSEDAIEQGDWYIQPEGLRKSAAKTDTCAFPKDSYKVVASTDSSLGLPMIPESFIRDYVELSGAITEVYLGVWTVWTQYMVIGAHLDAKLIGKLVITKENEVIVFLS